MPNYIVKEPLKHDGESYALGDPLELDAKTGKELLALGAVEVAKIAKTEAKPKPDAKPKDEAKPKSADEPKTAGEAGSGDEAGKGSGESGE